MSFKDVCNNLMRGKGRNQTTKLSLTGYGTLLFVKYLQALKWELSPVTIISWLNLYLQVDALKDVPKVLLPQYSQEKFIQIAQVGSKMLENGSWGSGKCY